MPRLPKYNSTKLFHKLAREAKNDWIAREGRKPTRDEWNQIQKWTSKNLYQEFKGKSYRTLQIVDIQKQVAFRTTPSEKRKCGNVFAIDLMDYLVIEWWNVWNKIEGLPKDVLVRVNAGDSFGVTAIKHAGDMQDDEITEIVENIREFLDNKSAGTTFEARIKEVPNSDGKKNNNCNFFIDIVLSDEEGLIDTEEAIERFDVDLEDEAEAIKREREAERKAKIKRQEKVKKSKKKRRPKSVAETPVKPKKKKKKKKAKASKVNVKEIRALISDLRQDVKDGLITKEFYQKEVAKITAKLEKGGKL